MGKPIVLIGFKASGKTTVGKALAKRLNTKFLDTDSLLEIRYSEITSNTLSSRQIYQEHGRDYFMEIETQVVKKVLAMDDTVISFGGGTVENAYTKGIDLSGPMYVYLIVGRDILYKRIMKLGLPAFFDKKNPRNSFDKMFDKRSVGFDRLANITVGNENKPVDEVVNELTEKLNLL